jgi:retron-type reverse transcriptase
LSVRRAGGLWPQVVALENLHRAAYAVLRGKRSRASAGDFFRDLEGQLLRLQRELVERRYAPGGYRIFWIRDPKRRLISAAPFRDRVVHHALVQVIEPVFERRFVATSYACRAGKGTHRALRRFVGWARETGWVLQLDVHRFFPSLDHAILKDRIRRAVKDPAVLWLCDAIIDGSNPQEPVDGWYPGDDLLAPLARRRGLPIGNLTSQFFANVYLDALDHHVKERLRVARYLRYVDDLACFDRDRERLRELRGEIAECLLGLRLRLNEGKSRLRRVSEGVGFLGFVVTPDRVRLGPKAVRRGRRRMRALRAAWREGSLDAAGVRRHLVPWAAHLAQGTTRGLLRSALAAPW